MLILIYLLPKRNSKQYTTACDAAVTTMLGRNKQEIFNYRSGEGRVLALSIGATPVVVIVYVIHSSNTNNINITTEHAPYAPTETQLQPLARQKR